MRFIANFTLGFVLFIFIYRLLRYLASPILKASGFYKYYSQMFCTMPYGRKAIEIHIGTSWDFFRLQKVNPSILLFHLAEGLYRLCDEIERGKIPPETIIRANLYYFSEATVQKFGFASRRPNLLEWVVFSLNYIELCIMLSISYRKLTRVRFENLMVIEGKAKTLASHKHRYRAICERLRTRDAVKPLLVESFPQSDRNVA